MSSLGPNHASDKPSFLISDPHAPIVGIGAIYNGSNADSYYFAAADGGVFAINATFYGSAAGLSLHAPIVAMALTPDNGGYWLVAADGGVFAFGDAHFYGSMGGHALDQPIVGMAVDRATGGYWLVGRDGGVFAFDAPFYGSADGLHLNAPMVGMESAPSGTGYRLVSSDGGIFSYNEPFYGSMAGRPLAHPVVGVAEDPATGGYWIASSDGGVFAFNAPFYGAGGQSAYGAGAAGHLSRRSTVRSGGADQRVRITTPALAPRPTVCDNATRAPSTWRGPHSPRSWRTSSTTCPSAEAPSGSPLESSPPLGLTGSRPPRVVAPESSSAAEPPGSHNPSSSYEPSSRAASVSWHSTTCRSDGPRPASS